MILIWTHDVNPEYLIWIILVIFLRKKCSQIDLRNPVYLVSFFLGNVNVSKNQKLQKLILLNAGCLRPINHEYSTPFKMYHMLTVILNTIWELFYPYLQQNLLSIYIIYQPTSDFIFLLNKRTSILFEVAIIAKIDVVIWLEQRQKDVESLMAFEPYFILRLPTFRYLYVREINFYHG